ncbi:hypothetical protein [Mesorhizobium sp.]|uniref:hypothetical protein n=1 Tax=Mesorhizobium sp. TaxID=1871066 RepID=UPI000FE88DCF|nr:hypothetical protein [Mesorhizobium sp.]RWD71635.1 MAG: hypothetical protein EOS37_11025 [Mesorhizobium sp.]
MLKRLACLVIGIGIGIAATLIVTSQAWVVASLKYNLTWEGGREWVGALSGWAAFVAAAASLPYLIGQWHEAKKQTRFAIGDEDPTLDVIEHLKDKNTLVIRIVNWNRRAIFVKDIAAVSKTKPENMTDQAVIWDAENEDGDIDTKLPIPIKGWEDRAARPGFTSLDLLLIRRAVGSEEDWTSDKAIPFPQDASITVTIQMLGNVHRLFELTARAFPTQTP